MRELAVRAGLAGVPEPVLAVCLLLAAGICIAAGLRAWQSTGTGGAAGGVSGKPTITRSAAPTAAATSRDASSTSSVLVVDVAGAVARPGVYRMPPGSRAADAVAAAGGTVAGADCDRINLASKVSDGQQLLVPRRSDPSALGAAPPSGGAGASAGGGAEAGGAARAAGGAGPVDLNTADEAALDALPGVGPATAKRIVDDRGKNGPFKSVDDLMRVPGIGPKKVDALRDLVTVAQ